MFLLEALTLSLGTQTPGPAVVCSEGEGVLQVNGMSGCSCWDWSSLAGWLSHGRANYDGIRNNARSRPPAQDLTTKAILSLGLLGHTSVLEPRTAGIPCMHLFQTRPHQKAARV